jgi:hypothetical protein
MDNISRGAEEQPDYQSYLLRLWRESDGERGWRASLESARTGERRGFADLNALFDFLQRQTDALPGTNTDVNAA